MWSVKKLTVLILVLSGIACVSVVHAEDWPQWGGPNRDNVSTERGWAESWPADGPSVLWQVNAGVGDGQIAVVDGRACSLGLFAPDGKTAVPRGKEQQASEVLLCLDAETGQEEWRRIVATGQVKRGRAWQYEHGTPTVWQGRVYVRSCWGHLRCYDAEDGELRWSRRRESLDAAVLDHGYQDSLLLLDGLLVFVVQTTEERKVQLVAISAEDGRDVWRADVGAGRLTHWSPPACAVIDGKRTVVALCNELLIGLDPADGQERWRFDVMKEAGLPGRAGSFGHTHGDANPPRICGDVIVAEARHFIKREMRCTSDYFAVRIENATPKLLWNSPDFVNWWDSQAVRGDHIYGIRRSPKGRFGSTMAKHAYRGGENAKSALECWEAATGELAWSIEHPAGPGTGGFVGAAFAVADDRLFLHDESHLTMGRISPEGYEHMASISLNGPAAPPVPAHGRIYVRTAADGTFRCFNSAEGEE